MKELENLHKEINQPILVGSGINKNNVNNFLKYCDGVIVGTSLKEDGQTNNPISKNNVIEFVKSVDY